MNIKKIHRSSVTGRIVSSDYAKKHPKTTETERVKVPNKRKQK